jgi:hypothetical protein
MKKINKAILLCLGAALTVGCSTLDEQQEALNLDQTCKFNGSNEKAPDWVCTGNHGSLITGRGSYDRNNASENLSFQIAQQRARADLARKLALNLKTSLNDYESVTGSEFSERLEQHVQGISKSELEMPIEGSRVYASVSGPDGTLYVLVGIDEEMAKQNKRRFVKSSFRDAEALWTKSEADKAYQQLEALLDKTQ